MKTLADVTCDRCGCATSAYGTDPKDLLAAYVCPDGERGDSRALTIRERVVPGPGERGKDDEGTS